MRTCGFESVTVVLPVMNETTSLRETIRILLRDVREDLKEIASSLFCVGTVAHCR